MFRIICVVLFILLSISSTVESSTANSNKKSSNKKKEREIKSTQEQKKLNFDLLPPLDDVLKELDLYDRVKDFIRMGVSDTRILILLKKMDFQMMLLEWENLSENDVQRLKDKIGVLISQATVEEKRIRPEISERATLKYGRLYLSDYVQSFEYLIASFGGPPPIGPLQAAISTPPHGCTTPDHPNDLSGKIVFLTRGECTFLEKAINMQKYNVSAIGIINNEDRLENAAAGLGSNKNITEEWGMNADGSPYEDIPHSYESIAASQHLANFFVSRCRRNGNKFSTAEEE
eukprot:gene9419-19554_t